MIKGMTKAEYDEYSKEYEDWCDKQGSWPFTPEDPLMDQQAKDIKEPKPSLHQLVTQTI